MNDTDDDFTKLCTCPLCNEYFKDPKLLSCHHLFCLECITKLRGKKKHAVCSICQKKTEFSKDSPPTSLPTISYLAGAAKQLAEGQRPKFLMESTMLEAHNGSVRSDTTGNLVIDNSKTFEDLGLAMSPDMDESPIIATEGHCHHAVHMKKSALTCPHCGQKFCKVCETDHKERLKAEMLEKASHFRSKTYFENLEEEVAKLNEMQITCSETQADVTFKRIEEIFSNFLRKKRQAVVDSIMKICSYAMFEFTRVLRDAKADEAQVSEVLATLKNGSVINLSMEELSEMYNLINMYPSRLQELERADKDFRAGQVFFNGVGRVESQIVAALSNIHDDFVQRKTISGMKSDLQAEVIPGFHAAALLGNVEDIKLCMDSFGEFWPQELKQFVIDHPDPSESGRTALHQATICGHLEVVRYLLEQLHCDPLILDDHEGLQRFPLHYAAEQFNLELFKVVLQHSKSVIEANEGAKLKRFLLTVGGNSNISFARHLLDFDSTIPERIKAFHGGSWAHSLAQFGKLEILRELHQRGFSFNSIDSEGNTPLHLARSNGHTAVVDFLAYVSPDLISVKNNWGKTYIDCESFVCS